MTIKDSLKNYFGPIWKKYKKLFIGGFISYLVVIYVCLQYSAYSIAYSEQGFLELISTTIEGIKKYPFSLPAVPITGLSVIGFVTFFIIIVCLMMYLKHKANTGEDQSTSQGSAHWNTDYEGWKRDRELPNRNMVMTQRVNLGYNKANNNNILVIGGSGAGKSRFFVKPNLCELPLNVSFIITDPSGELLTSSGNMLEGAGYKIKVFDLVDLKNSGRYNPLKYITSETDAITLTDCIMNNTSDPDKKGGDAFWDDAQKLMLQSFIYLLWLHGDKLHLPVNMNTIVELTTWCKVEEGGPSGRGKGESTTQFLPFGGSYVGTLASKQGGKTTGYFEAIEKGFYWNGNELIVEENRDKVPEGCEYHEGDPNDLAVFQYHQFMIAGGKTLQSILISAEARFRTFSTPDVKRLFGGVEVPIKNSKKKAWMSYQKPGIKYSNEYYCDDDMDLGMIGDEKTALFIILPQGANSFAALSSMMYTQLFQMLYNHAQNECLHNILIKDIRGEVIKVIPTKAEKQKIQYTDDEEDIDWKNADLIKEEEAKKYDYKQDPAYKDGLIFVERCKKTLKTVLLNGKFVLKLPECEINGVHYDEEVIATYASKKNAKDMYESLKTMTEKNITCNFGQELPFHTRFIMDEFANIGKVPNFIELLATMRKYQISATVIIQSITQIKKMYEHDWGSILDNCASMLYLGFVTHDETLKYLSEKLGKKTMRVLKRNSSLQGNGSTSSGKNVEYIGRDLMTVDEVAAMHRSKCIYFLAGESAFFDNKFDVTKHRNYDLLSDKEGTKVPPYDYVVQLDYNREPVKKEIELVTETINTQYDSDMDRDNTLKSNALNNKSLMEQAKIDVATDIEALFGKFTFKTSLKEEETLQVPMGFLDNIVESFENKKQEITSSENDENIDISVTESNNMRVKRMTLQQNNLNLIDESGVYGSTDADADAF